MGYMSTHAGQTKQKYFASNCIWLLPAEKFHCWARMKRGPSTQLNPPEYVIMRPHSFKRTKLSEPCHLFKPFLVKE
ncbi:hypothetical protein MRX96_027751 [Rhipicephalus microplus]